MYGEMLPLMRCMQRCAFQTDVAVSRRTSLCQRHRVLSCNAAATGSSLPAHVIARRSMPLAPSDPERKRICIKQPDGATAVAVYTDKGVSTSDQAVFVAIHGAPGSTFDWRWLGAGIEPHGRFIRLDLPGHGESEAGLTASSSRKDMTNAVWNMVHQLPGVSAQTPIVLVGHSLGSDLTLQMAAQHPSCIRGVALINPIGLRPHKALRPYWFMLALCKAIDAPFIKHAMPPFLWLIYVYLFGFPKRVTAQEVVWCQRRVGARDFEALRRDVEAVVRAHIPSLIAYAEDDALVETAIPLELVEVLQPQQILRFRHGGHYLQKEHSATLAAEIVKLGEPPKSHTPLS